MTGSLPTLVFGACQLKLATRELTVDGELIDLQPLVFDLLAYMVQNPNRVIGKDELLNTVWRSPFITDSVVTRAVMKARRAILPLQSGDQAAHALGGPMASLIHHFLESEVRLALLPMADIFTNWDRFLPEADPLAAACRWLGARAALPYPWQTDIADPRVPGDTGPLQGADDLLAFKS